MKLALFLCFQILASSLFGDNIIEIYPVNGKLNVTYFPAIDEFTNPFHGMTLTANRRGTYVPDISHVKNKMLVFIVNDRDIEIYVGKNDSIKILFDVIKNDFVIEGDNKNIHENYNALKIEYRTNHTYERLFDYKNFNHNKTDVIEDIKRKIIIERKKIYQLLSPNSISNPCYETYLTSFHISMLIWIREGFPENLRFEDHLQDILETFNFNEDVIKGSSYGFSYYDIYYKTTHSTIFTSGSTWLDRHSYLLNAPDNIRDYLLQCQYIGQYNSIRPYVNWCELFTEIEVIFDKIYFTAFFEEHKPCK